MSFDGLFLHHLKQELQILKSGRLVKIAEIGDTDFIFTIRSDKTNHQLMLSFASDFARVHLTEKKYDTSSHPKSFTMLLRKHLEGYFLKDFFQYESDRILVFMFTGYNEMRDYNQKYLICEVMGRYSNLILTTDTYSIIDVLKKDGVGEYNRTMLPNAIYRFPETNKKNPLARSLQSLQQDTVFSPKDLIACYNGISMLAAEYCFQTDAVHQTLYQLIHETIHPVILLNKNQKKDFYFQACNNPVLEAYPSLSALLDQFYYEAEKTYTIKQKNTGYRALRRSSNSEKYAQNPKIESGNAFGHACGRIPTLRRIIDVLSALKRKSSIGYGIELLYTRNGFDSSRCQVRYYHQFSEVF